MPGLTPNNLDWRSVYGFNQPMSPEQAAYWKLNGENGNRAMWNVNRMPYVYDLHEDGSLDRKIARDNIMIGGNAMTGGGTGGGTGPTGGQNDLLAQLLSDPRVVEQLLLLLQNANGGNVTGR